MTTNRRDNLQEAALAHLWMPTQDWSELAEDGVTIMAEADGVRIKDADGNWGYDGISGLMLVNVGPRTEGDRRRHRRATRDHSLRQHLQVRRRARHPLRREGRVAHPRRPQPRLLHQRRLRGRRNRPQGRLPLPLQPRRARKAQVHRTRRLLPRNNPRRPQRLHLRRPRPPKLRRNPARQLPHGPPARLRPPRKQGRVAL